VSLIWDPSPSAIGYKIYFWGASLTGTNIQSVGNATNTTISSLLPGATYYFAATAIDAAGEESDFSNQVTYTVPLAPLIISSIPDQVLDANSVTGSLPFTMSDAQTAASNLVVSATSSNLALVPLSGVILGGSGPNRTVTVTPVAGQVGSSRITLNASDGTSSNSISFVLTVTPLPAIALTSPPNLSWLSTPAAITLAANVISNGHAIAGVQFYNGATLLGADSSPPYTLTWTNVSAGKYRLLALATDELGSSIASAPSFVIVTNGPIVGGPPTLVLTSPADGGIYPLPVTLTLAVNVVSNGHAIKSIHYYNGATYLGAAITPPYAFPWTATVAGAYAFSALLVYDTLSMVVSPTATIELIDLPPTWLSADLGGGAIPGAAGQTNGFYLVSGAGMMGGPSDSFHFAYQSMSGDGSLYAQVTSVQDTGSNGFAGVMVRESLDAGAKYAAAGLTPDGRILWSTRANSNGFPVSTTTIPSAAPARWLSLMRTNNAFYGFCSTDGLSWSAVGATSFTMSSNTFAGLAVNSGSSNTFNTSSFTNVNLNP